MTMSRVADFVREDEIFLSEFSKVGRRLTERDVKLNVYSTDNKYVLHPVLSICEHLIHS